MKLVGFGNLLILTVQLKRIHGRTTFHFEHLLKVHNCQI
jgi:hypothetical protein